jgi:hypothetical protein
MNGVKENKPFPITEQLKVQDAVRPFILGFCPHLNTYFKGQIAEVKISNKFNNNIEEIIKTTDNLVLHYDFNRGLTNLVNQDLCENINVEFKNEKIELIDNILPYRIEGRFDCLPHIDEGFVNGKWAKGETTARNERRFVTEMQQRKINYRDEGINKIESVTYVDSVDESTYKNTRIINTLMI